MGIGIDESLESCCDGTHSAYDDYICKFKDVNITNELNSQINKQPGLLVIYYLEITSNDYVLLGA